MDEKCPLHDAIVDGIEDKITNLTIRWDRLEGRITTGIILVVILSFFAGANTVKGVLELALKIGGN